MFHSFWKKLIASLAFSLSTISLIAVLAATPAQACAAGETAGNATYSQTTGKIIGCDTIAAPYNCCFRPVE